MPPIRFLAIPVAVRFARCLCAGGAELTIRVLDEGSATVEVRKGRVLARVERGLEFGRFKRFGRVKV